MFGVDSKRSNFITRLAADKKQSLIMRLLYLAEVLSIAYFSAQYLYYLVTAVAAIAFRPPMFLEMGGVMFLLCFFYIFLFFTFPGKPDCPPSP